MNAVGARSHIDPLAPFHPAVRDWFSAAFDAPTRPQALGWPAIARGDSTLILAPTGSGKTLDRVPLVPRSADVHAGAAEGTRAAACSTSRRSRRSRSTSSATCARRSPASRRSPSGAAIAFVDAGDRDPHRRHAAGRARALSARAGRHPDHHAGIALPAADVERARGAALGRHGHHRRDPRAGADQARRAPGAVARAARGALRAAAAAHRAVGDAAAARRGGAVPRRRRTVVRHTELAARRPQARPRRAAERGRRRDRARVRRRIAAPSTTARSRSSTPARRRR